MTEKFKNLTEKMARGLNFGNGAICLIAIDPDTDELSVDIKQSTEESETLCKGIAEAVRQILPTLNENAALEACEWIVKAVADELAQRFRETKK